MSFDRLIRKIVETKNPTVVGLDPKLEYIPEELKAEAYAKYGKTLEGAAEAILSFNKGIIDAICDVVPAVKPQCAFYERFGWQGMKALAETIAYAKEKGMFVIIDGKRNDIGSTMDCLCSGPPGRCGSGRRGLHSLRRRCPHRQRLSGHRRHRPCSRHLRSRRTPVSLYWSRLPTPLPASCRTAAWKAVPVYAAMGEMCEKWGEELHGRAAATRLWALW